MNLKAVCVIMNPKEIFFNHKDNCNVPFTHIQEDITYSSLKTVDELYGAADVLSIQNAMKHQQMIWLLSIIGTLITIAFLLYDEAELHELILTCIILIVILFGIQQLAKNSAYHKKIFRIQDSR